MSKLFQVEIRDGLVDLSTFLKTWRIRGGFEKLTGEIASQAADEIANLVRMGYERNSAERKASTLQTYLQGKSAGNIPARARWAGSSLSRSGALRAAVVTRKVSKGWIVEIDQQAVYNGRGDTTDDSSYGGGKVVHGQRATQRPIRLRDIAVFMEEGAHHTLRLTLSMVRYLKALEAGTAGTSVARRRPTENVDLGRTISMTIHARPVWKKVREKINTIFATKYAADLKMRFERAAAEFVGKPVQIRFY